MARPQFARFVVPALVLASPALGEVPTYRVEVISSYDTTLFLGDASEAGHIAGSWTVLGQLKPLVMSLESGIVELPLPPGFISGMALDVNSSGVVVGTVATNSFPFDLGEPAIWTPDGAGGYTVTIPQQFSVMPSPLGMLSINGGQALTINDAGDIVGWSRYQGFQGGPTTRFSLSGPPVDLKALGFEATVQDLSENGLIAGDGLVMDLATNQVRPLGIPTPPTDSFPFVIAYAVNNGGEAVVAARRATSTNDVWLTYLNHPETGYAPLNPAQLPTRFVGFYDNNNRGDVSATGGVLFAAEGVLAPGFNGLLEPESAHWSVGLGFIKDDRRVYTTGQNSLTGESAVVVLVPTGCPGDLNGDGLVNVDDIDAFTTAFVSGDLAADLDGNGLLNVDDVDAFAFAFAGGCP